MDYTVFVIATYFTSYYINASAVYSVGKLVEGASLGSSSVSMIYFDIGTMSYRYLPVTAVRADDGGIAIVFLHVVCGG